MDGVAILQDRITQLESIVEMSEQQRRPTTPSTSRTSVNGFVAGHGTQTPLEGFPAMFFLDSEIFKEARMSIPRPAMPIPEEIYASLNTIDNVRAIAARFFSTVHMWFPFVSKKRMELTLSNPSLELQADLALLLVAMQLITDESSNCHTTALSPLYWSVKNYFSILESQGLLSPQLLQSGILVATYEIGHAIYPAAYISPGRLARIGQALGLDNRRNAPQMLRRHGAWAELEELRRTWWSVMLLDRSVIATQIRFDANQEQVCKYWYQWSRSGNR